MQMGQGVWYCDTFWGLSILTIIRVDYRTVRHYNFGLEGLAASWFVLFLQWLVYETCVAVSLPPSHQCRVSRQPPKRMTRHCFSFFSEFWLSLLWFSVGSDTATSREKNHCRQSTGWPQNAFDPLFSPTLSLCALDKTLKLGCCLNMPSAKPSPFISN